ncbi:MAG: CTP synthase [Anaerolineae bacterium]
MTKYIFCTGGVVSSLGKGVTAASLGRILKSRGLSVSVQKLDPYLNVDPGTMSPYEHGEVFVLDDGAETDLDLGAYERFIDENLTRASNVTAGQVYQRVITRERRGDYLGKTIQVIPHVTNMIKASITQVARESGAEVVIVEVGGTVGDIEGLPFLEALRQMRKDAGRDNTLYVHVTLLPHMSEWRELVSEIKHPKPAVRVAIVGKYIELHDAYISVREALHHAAIHQGCDVDIRWVSSEQLERGRAVDQLEQVDGIVVPGGFGYRGIEGKVVAARFARENKVPYLGLCLGMQVMVIELARHVFKSDEPNSTEFDMNTKYPIIDLMPEQRDIADIGGTMRLGIYPCRLVEDTKAYAAYGEALAFERHRHRFEFNNLYRKDLEEAGMIFSGLSPNGRLVEIAELRDHPFMLGSQFHPEFRSRPTRPHPLFNAFIRVVRERTELLGVPESDGCEPQTLNTATPVPRG